MLSAQLEGRRSLDLLRGSQGPALARQRLRRQLHSRALLRALSKAHLKVLKANLFFHPDPLMTQKSPGFLKGFRGLELALRR